MSKKAHTPGKWEAKGRYVFAGNNCIGICDTDNDTETRMKANARVMAAGSEMLEALRAWKAYDTFLRSLPLQGPLYGGELTEVDKAYDACVIATDAAISKATGGQ